MTAWVAQAACAGLDMFPESHQGQRVAQAVCASCGVRAECLADALATGERHGVRGGLIRGGRGPRPRGVKRAVSPRPVTADDLLRRVGRRLSAGGDSVELRQFRGLSADELEIVVRQEAGW